jgi:dihydrofolate reductase/thymidylate synthase
MINLIASVYLYQNKLAIGRNNDLLFKLKKDTLFFKNITTNSLTSDSKLDQNIVLMGRKTWESIPKKYRPLNDRINLILTNNIELIKSNPVPQNRNLNKGCVYFLNRTTFDEIYKKYNPNVFVIGGSDIYNMFLREDSYSVDRIYLTQIHTTPSIKFTKENEPNVFIDHPDSTFKLISYSEKYHETDISYRILTYHRTNQVSDEYKYLNLAKHILENGNIREDRTGTGTISLFGTQLRFDISNGNLPLLTTKQVPLKAIIEELLFFCRGDTNANILDKRGVKIWNSNTTREFLDKRGLHHYPEGCMGPMYGWSWRNFGATYSPDFSDTSRSSLSLRGFDQLSHVEHLLKTDPFSRRIYISNLNPAESSKMCLDMCHSYIQFYVEEINGIKYLSGYFMMRSSDNIAWNFNILSYQLLIYILALKCDMKPKEIVYNAVDCHIYKNHIDQIKEQLTRTPRPFPHIKLDDSLKNKDWSEMEYSDFELIGYMPYPSIKMPMAI